MDKLQSTGQNLKSRNDCTNKTPIYCYEAKLSSLKLKTQAEQPDQVQFIFSAQGASIDGQTCENSSLVQCHKTF